MLFMNVMTVMRCQVSRSIYMVMTVMDNIDKPILYRALLRKVKKRILVADLWRTVGEHSVLA